MGDAGFELVTSSLSVLPGPTGWGPPSVGRVRASTGLTGGARIHW